MSRAFDPDGERDVDFATVRTGRYKQYQGWVERRRQELEDKRARDNQRLRAFIVVIFVLLLFVLWVALQAAYDIMAFIASLFGTGFWSWLYLTVLITAALISTGYLLYIGSGWFERIIVQAKAQRRRAKSVPASTTSVVKSKFDDD